MKSAALCVAVLAALIPLPAHAVPGEAAAIMRHCGVPHAEDMGVSPVTGRPERSLIYNQLILHFEPAQGGWSFTTGWRGHFPVTRNELRADLPCFRAALDEAAATPRPTLDPTIARQISPGPITQSNWGIPHLWLIAALVATLLIFLLMPSRPNAATPVAREPERRYRTPDYQSRIWRRRPPMRPLT